MFHDPVRHGEGWFRGAVGTGVSGVVIESRGASEGGCEAPPAGQEEEEWQGKVKTSSDEHQSTERIAALAFLAS